MIRIISILRLLKNTSSFGQKRLYVLYKTQVRFNQNTSTFKNKRKCVFQREKTLLKRQKKQGQLFL